MLSSPLDLSHVAGYTKLKGFWVRGKYATQDNDVINEVYVNDGYQTRIRPSYGDGEIVLDIGAHIGTFAKKWHEKNPTARIVCIEACPDNIEVLTANVGHFAEVVHAACSYQDEIQLLNSILPGGRATGGSMITENVDAPIDESLYWLDNREIPTVTIEDIREQFDLDRIDIMKLDCEGSEFDILGNMQGLDDVKFVCGEYHGFARWEEFRQRIFEGWSYGHMHSAGGLGIFHYANDKFHESGEQPG